MNDLMDDVEYLLRYSKKARNSDGYLFLLWLRGKGIEVSTNTDVSIINSLNQLKSVARARRKLQENGAYMSDSQIQEWREKKRREMIKSGGQP